MTTVFVELPNTKIELIEPLGEDSPIAAFLERNPAGGIHHLCYEVDDIRPRRAALAGDRRARARRRRAEDRRARQAGAVPSSQGFPRHADRAGAGVSAMGIGTLHRHLFRRLVGRALRRPALGHAHARRKRARWRSAPTPERAGATRCSFARRSPRRSSRRSSSVLLWLAVGGITASASRAIADRLRAAPAP